MPEVGRGQAGRDMAEMGLCRPEDGAPRALGMGCPDALISSAAAAHTGSPWTCSCWKLELYTCRIGRVRSAFFFLAKIYSFALCLLIQLPQYLFVKAKVLLQFEMLWHKTFWRMTSICTSHTCYCGWAGRVHVQADCILKGFCSS